MSTSSNITNLLKYFNENKLAHAYLIETNNQEKCLNDLNILFKTMFCNDKYKQNCSNCNICLQVEKNEFPNLIIVRPDGISIKKEQVLEVKRKLSFIPLLSKNKIYVFMGAEKLNSSSANTMLKFIEEPEENCYGFFLTDCKENVLLTIQSRCEIFKINYKENDFFIRNNIDEETKNNLINKLSTYLYKIEVEKKDTIMYNRDVLLKDLTDKKELEYIFKLMFEVYDSYFLQNTGVEVENSYPEYNFINKNKILTLNKKINLIASVINKINYNLNIELMVDKFVIEMSEIDG